jgi:enhancing lycopene biosynthesis protein 2
MEVNLDVLKFCEIFAKTNKPAGYICIAPTLVNKIYGAGVAVTIGNDADTIRAIESMGGEHKECAVSQVCVDAEHKVVTTPAYMLAKSILEAQSGIEKCVRQVVDWA